MTELNKMIAPAKVTSLDDITYAGTDGKASFTINGFSVKFDSQDGKTTGLTGTLANGSVSVTIPEATNNNNNNNGGGTGN